MNAAQLEKLAREAGITIATWGGVRCSVPDLTRFAALVRAAVLTEAAEVCDAVKNQKNELGRRTKNHYGPAIASGAMLAAEALRALAQQAGGEAPPC